LVNAVAVLLVGTSSRQTGAGAPVLGALGVVVLPRIRADAQAQDLIDA